MTTIAAALRDEIGATLPRLTALSESQVSADRGPGKWVRKEILGHLIDSAANNHQRFVRAPLSAAFVGPGYDQRHWVVVHAYRHRPWRELVELWAALNLHVAHAIEGVPEGRLATPCTIGHDAPATLEWVMHDYLRHMRHHLDQILESPGS